MARKPPKTPVLPDDPAQKQSKVSRRPAKLSDAELKRRADQRAVRCLELKALVAAEAKARGGVCQRPGCTTRWQPGTLAAPNPVHWHHTRAHVRRSEPRMISMMVANASTTDAALKAELQKCVLLCRHHHYEADAEIRGRNHARSLSKAIEPDHLERLLAAPNVRRLHGLRSRLVLELMAKCGMRVSEVCNLTLRNLRQSDWRIEIRESKTGDRFLYLPVQLESLMVIWLDRRARELPKSKWLFPTSTGGRISRGNVAGMIDRLTERAEIPATHPHALRHTFATEFIRNRGDVATLQEILGHSTATMSMRYARSNPERVRRALRGE